MSEAVLDDPGFLTNRPGFSGGSINPGSVHFRSLLAEAADAGTVRDDVAPDELATYCLHALSAASTLP